MESSSDNSVPSNDSDSNKDWPHGKGKPSGNQMVSMDDYESLPSDKLSHIMMAGASAGIMEHCVMFPFDTVKVCKNLIGEKKLW